MKNKAPVSKNEELTATIEDLTYQGMGVAKVDGYPLFVAGALPGEQVKLHVLKADKKYGFAKAIDYLTTSPDRVAPGKKELVQTGIAPLQHWTYAAQLKYKRKLVTDLLQKSHLSNLEVAPTVGMENPSGYRNKAQVPARDFKGQLTTGFFRRGSHNFVPLEDYFIQDPRIDEVILVVRDILREFKVPAYNEEKHTGVIRNVMVRRGHYSGEVMVVLVTKTKKLMGAAEISAQIQEKCSDVVSVIQNINSEKTNVILGKTSKVLRGRNYIQDQLNGLTFNISAQSFYQVNPVQTEKLYARAVELADLTGTETVVDAYCGIGTISLSLAQAAKQVYGVEIVPEAIADAKENARLNNLKNLTFETGNAEDALAKWVSDGIQPDVIMVDPPRKGLTENFIEAAVKAAPQKVVYVSCNPATLVRDIERFGEQGYSVIGALEPFDQFPQTTHVETIAVLEKAAD
ncbi:TrmA family RNA methyltransferase [Ligilactobacillus salitolerans]|uniref:TrmA family RNA methyltransferase n=1 Tax=Ligilactobacillus salitolerans TaxID=1808352 RepID=A0A401IT83_9LACO|nr:23S rRNA (uracil(1939)-C(5))-methyltransferase RlmD [Ligilactobacillus salitolerans]GBG94741.1 TrmA family RNA methyltransferase [Ligilactobacillus salitolerans]